MNRKERFERVANYLALKEGDIIRVVKPAPEINVGSADVPFHVFEKVLFRIIRIGYSPKVSRANSWSFVERKDCVLTRSTSTAIIDGEWFFYPEQIEVVKSSD